MANQAFFSPGMDCLQAIQEGIENAKEEILVCVFTISDDRILQTLLDSHRKGMKIRILTDNEKVHDKGSDIRALVRAGLDVKVDDSQHHMHHKFMIVDGVYTYTGSYNWTRSAERFNAENLVIIEDPELASSFIDQFETLWESSVRLYSVGWRQHHQNRNS